MIDQLKKTNYAPLGQREPRFSLPRIIILFSTIILLLNIFIVVKRGIDSRNVALDEGQVALEHLTHTISKHVDLTFSAADVTLLRAVDRQYFNELFGGNLTQDMQNNFANWVNESSQISAMVMTDHRGNIIAMHQKTGHEGWLKNGSGFSNHPAYISHKTQRNNAQLYIGKNLSSSGDYIVMSRMYSRLDGSFGGVVAAAIDSSYITNFFESIELDNSSELTILREDGFTLVNQVSSEEKGAQLKEYLMPRLTQSNLPQGTTKFEDKTTVYSFWHVPSMELIIAIASDTNHLLSNWRRERLSDIIFLSVFVLFVVVISFFVIAVTRQMQRVQHSERTAVLANQAKSDFLANMSHELRTPLNAIIGFSEMMSAGYFGKMNKKQNERLNDIHNCGTHLLELINDLLEFSKGEAGKIELRNEKIKLLKVITETKRMMDDKAKREDITLETSIEPDLPILMGDERKIKQILINLVSNALKFTKEKGMVEISSYLDDEKNLVLSVTDTGCGMKEGDIPKALSAFGQVHNDPAHGGTGLGLPLCKMFAELHGGELTLQSIENVGTKVTITFPKSRVLLRQGNIEALRPNINIDSNEKDSASS